MSFFDDLFSRLLHFLYANFVPPVWKNSENWMDGRVQGLVNLKEPTPVIYSLRLQENAVQVRIFTT